MCHTMGFKGSNTTYNTRDVKTFAKHIKAINIIKNTLKFFLKRSIKIPPISILLHIPVYLMADNLRLCKFLQELKNEWLLPYYFLK